MARKRGRLDFKNEASQVASLFKKETVGWKKERLQALKLLLETNKSYVEVAQIVSRSPSRVKAWAKAFRDGGLQTLLTRGNGGGRKPLIKEDAKEALKQKLEEGEFRTAVQIERWLDSQFNLRYGKGSIYYVLGKLGGRLKVPRPSHLKKNEEEAAAFRTTLADKLRALDLPKDKAMSLWVYDEMRYGLHPLLRRMWSLAGKRVVAPVHRRFKWGYVFGAIEVGGAGSEFMYTDGLSKMMDAGFIEQVAKSDPEKMHVIIGDGAAFHNKEGQTSTEELPANVRILTLPAYSPELNPIEKLWDIVKDVICTVAWADLGALEEKLTEVLREWWERPDGFASLFTSSYLVSELNATGNPNKSCLFC